MSNENKQVGIAVDIAGENIMIAFDREVTFLQFNPRQALELAEAIAKKALKLSGKEKKSDILLPSYYN